MSTVEFAFSFGLTTATLSWILGYLPARPRTKGALAIVYAVASAGDLALPHAIALHAVQVLPLLALLGAGAATLLPLRRRVFAS